ncbi:DUF3237 domain-containing protein [Belnapia rosea]|uniref:UPF0311 protein SAMN04487779_10045 n=1 Tax=Belnapia rosea TaxID=938405 RepID=A0A1G6RGE7_9PROT|nr:DUF3237 domain-containing protein [Belnapia rosea]SDB74150.1 Protein of unknown function [Belnapia rosea]SDD03702.1 Protein of unknown function [Belnapia rosea]
MTPLPLATEFLFRAVLTVGAPQAVGATRSGDLRVIPVTGGSISGPALNGEVLPGTAADWLRVDPDGTAHMDVRLTIKTTEGHIVFMHYSGIRTAKPEVLARLNAGEAVDTADYYFRTAIRFETGAAPLAWLTRILAVGVGQRPPAGPTYDVYAVK